ncbi:MAG: dTDP-4-dehydrorhamnose 3,5-epimerase [Limisphaerales bacterium]|jgi:dTDP-4-dehydrorhamnose 3,5-epimerase
MNVISTSIAGLIVFEPKVFEDKRGYFMETYNRAAFGEAGVDLEFVQDNQSLSGKGVLRGLHYQKNPHAQDKLVRVLSGEVWDVAVDLRAGSPTFGKWHGEYLSAENKRQMLVPAGFAHGFLVLSETAEFYYKCSALYSKASEGGIRFDDPKIGIEWPLPINELIISDRDMELPLLAEADFNFELV